MNTFSKSKRLLEKKDYDLVFSQSNKLANSEFIILYCKNDSGHARLGLAISKKMVSKAHDRNRLKRIVRETFRTTNLPEIDIVVLAKRGVATIPNSILIPNLHKSWSKLPK
jgi:ribonuclease P protein component